MDETNHSSESLRQVVDGFWETFPPLWRSIQAHIRQVAAEQFNITVEQFHILRHIHKGAHSVSELADIGHISRPAISQAVDALVNKDLVSRTQSAADRRYVKLELTPDGSALLDAIFGQARQWMKTKLTSLEAGDMQTVMSGLTLLKEAFCDE